MTEQVPVKQNKVLWWLPAMLVVALGLSVWSWVSKDNANTNASNTNDASQNVNVSQNTNAAVTYTYPGQDGKNALELLKVAYPDTTTTTSGSLGEYVTGINGRTAGSNEFWEFQINGVSATVGAGTYVTKATDTIEWRLTSF